jgi:SAM-dependent methyltransferase
MAGRAHWDDRYTTIGAQSVSWFQDRPAASLDLLSAVGVVPSTSVIDVGGGASNLVDHLLRAGHTDLGVLDLSAVALAVARERVGDEAPVTWLVEDLLEWNPERRWDVWHDRAVLHFLLTDDDRRGYVEVLRRTVAPGGAVVIGTFAEYGPTECSALPVRRHSLQDLRDLLGPIDVIAELHEVHQTPSGAEQPFNWLAARLREVEA